MLPANLTLTSLQAAILQLANAPIDNNTYSIINLDTGHCLTGPSIAGGIPATEAGCTQEPNQAWLYLDYPPPDHPYAPVTLQVQSAPTTKGRGGYLRVNDTSSNSVEAGGAPQAWKLIPLHSGSSVFKITPFEDVFSDGGTLVVSSVTMNVPPKDQVQLHEDANKAEQLWVFGPLD